MSNAKTVVQRKLASDFVRGLCLKFGIVLRRLQSGLHGFVDSTWVRARREIRRRRRAREGDDRGRRVEHTESSNATYAPAMGIKSEVVASRFGGIPFRRFAAEGYFFRAVATERVNV